MGLVDKFKSFIGYPDEGYYSEEEEVQEKAEPGVYQAPQVAEFPLADKRSNKVVNIHATTQLQVVLVKPERFDDASNIADHLNGKRTVVLNLEAANKDVTRRLLDFLSGVAYANNGTIQKVASSTYIITPYNVGIMGDLLDELESSGMFF